MKIKKELQAKERGITLIALVITIIVLLILAGVSIAMLTGENGILSQAQRAKSETENAAKNEAAILDEYNNTLNNYINGVSIPEGLEIGSEVKYNPNGTYDWQSKYCSSPEDTSYQKTLNSGDGQPFNINTWKVFDINETTGEVLLVPEHSTDDRTQGKTSGTVDFYGAQGYNNAVYLLNEACSYLYGDSNKGITARSINIDDIEGKMTDTVLKQAHSYSNAGNKYWEQISSGYAQSSSYYPSLYLQEALRSDNNGNRITSGIGMSEQTSLVNLTDNGAMDGYLQGISIRPTQTFWYEENSFMKTAFENSSNGINYYDLLMPDNTNTYYWIASRCMQVGTNECDFAVRAIDVGGMSAAGLFDSRNVNSNGYSGLFPVVSLSAELITGNSESGFSVE